MRKNALVTLLSLGYFGFFALFVWDVATPLSATVQVNQGDECFRCQRMIVHTQLAGEIVDRYGIAYKFRQPACMAQYIHEAPTAPLPWREVLVTDYVSGLMIPVEHAYFVEAVINPRTGERDFLAFRNRTAAIEYAYQYESTVADWSTVLAEGARRAQVARGVAD